MELRCIACILNRGYLQIQEATEDESIRFETLSSILNFLTAEFKPTSNPAYLGTKRDQIIKKITGNSDPYLQKKKLSNQKALEILPIIKKLISQELSSSSKFRKACLSAIVGNIIEFNLPENPFEFNDLKNLIQEAEKDLAIDDIDLIFEEAKKAETVLYLTDNAGEIAFDMLLVEELKKLGTKVIVAVKSGPILNDATIEDAQYVGMDKVADKLITTGSDFVGLFPEDCSEDFINIYNSIDFVIAKGMGHAETITGFDLSVPHALLLRTKCCTVANHFNVSTGKNLAKLLN
ncbi:MAG: ARMT1-like domain-containing protein [Candidatus Bathyarchaeota archaeon]